MEIRLAKISDAEAIRKIYEPYVKETAISFEYEVPSINEFENRIKNTLAKYPYLVAVENGIIVGYAYASVFHNAREAYKHSAELSVYVDMNHKQKGIGKSLYTKLQEILITQNVYIVHACIASTENGDADVCTENGCANVSENSKDAHLTNDSEKFHAKMGFELAGRHKNCGYKFGNWYSVIWMDKVINDGRANPEEFIPFSQLEISDIGKVGNH